MLQQQQRVLDLKRAEQMQIKAQQVREAVEKSAAEAARMAEIETHTQRHKSWLGREKERIAAERNVAAVELGQTLARVGALIHQSASPVSRKRAQPSTDGVPFWAKQPGAK